jgi:hypothetical protein
MLKKTILATIALAFLPTIASAGTSEQKTFSHNGQTYHYTVKQSANGKTIKGATDDGLKPFKLIVSKYFVEGHFDGAPVRFSRKSIKSLQGTVEVATR